ncbi:MAG: hypothetical protein IPF45_05600 [Thermomonas sp.]|nr:hypothetical protein [Thermomonas sp.]
MSDPWGCPWEGTGHAGAPCHPDPDPGADRARGLQGADLDSLLQGICECLVAELPVAIASVILLDEANQSFVHEVL